MTMAVRRDSQHGETVCRDPLFRVLPMAGLVLLTVGSTAQACSPGPMYNACVNMENQRQRALQAQQQENARQQAVQQQMLQQQALQRQQALEAQQRETARQQAAQLQQQQQLAQEAARQQALRAQQQQAVRQPQETAREQAIRAQQLRQQELHRQQALEVQKQETVRQQPLRRQEQQVPARQQQEIEREQATGAQQLPRREDPRRQASRLQQQQPQTGVGNPQGSKQAERASLAGSVTSAPSSMLHPAIVPPLVGSPSASVAAPRVIVIDHATTITPMADHRGFSVTHQNVDGSQLVVNERRSGSSKPIVNAYLLKQNSDLGTQTRIYSDGHRITTGPGFVTRSALGRPTYIIHSDGLRDALLPDGHKWFEESKLQLFDRDRHPHDGVQRTVFAGLVGGDPVPAGKPVVQTFVVAPVHGVRTFAYVPRPLPPIVLRTLVVPFWQPIVVSAACTICPPPAVVFDDPPTEYADPADLLADLQVSGAVADGMVEVGADANSVPTPDAQDLDVQLATLQFKLDNAAADDSQLKEQLHEQPRLVSNLQYVRPISTAASTSAPVRVTKAVQQQLRREVKEDMIEQVQQNPLLLSDLIASPEALRYVFEVSDMIETTDTTAGADCSLTGGDLVSFANLPADGDVTAHVKVVSGKDSSCRPDAVLEVSLSDLQDMLNAFSERLENNMTKVHQWIASADPR